MTAVTPTPPPAPPAAGTPVPYRVLERRDDTKDTAIVLEPRLRSLEPFVPGQFAMLYAFGTGDIPSRSTSNCAAARSTGASPWR
jgi:NAD(P)H-flavin reductase